MGNIHNFLLEIYYTRIIKQIEFTKNKREKNAVTNRKLLLAGLIKSIEIIYFVTVVDINEIPIQFFLVLCSFVLY